jgi:hypothetical protein
MYQIRQFLPFILLSFLIGSAGGQEPLRPPHLSAFGAGGGPTEAGDGVYRLLDAKATPRQSNAIAWDRQHEGHRESFTLKGSLRVLEGGDGGAFVFLNTAEYGARGPAPFVSSWVEPNLRKSLAVGIDVHNPKNEEMFSAFGNYQGLPEREVSLHWDGREIVKRVAPAEFRGDFADFEIAVTHVAGGAEVSVRIGEGKVYERYFVAGCLPYENRLAIGAGTRADLATEMDVRGLQFEAGAPAKRLGSPLHVEIFNHVLTDNKKTSFDAEVELPPAAWDFGRVILTLEIHDAGPDWDEWDRNGHLYVFDDAGKEWDIVPFITSYRTPCHWKVDVTHFRPLLAGKRRFRIAAGTTFYKNRGYMMSVSLDYHRGPVDLVPYRVEPLWVGTARYRSADNHFQDFFEPKQVAIGPETKAARLFVTTTGHSQIGEFMPSKRTLEFRPDAENPDLSERFENVLWKSDCYLNPNRPQYGTWKFSRAGWAPGDVVRPWWIDLTPHVQVGKTAELRYHPSPYDFSGSPKPPADNEINKASHVVRSYLILYREPSGSIPAPMVRVTKVVKDSPAAGAGMRAGDYLVSYADTPIGSVEDLRAAIKEAVAAGETKVSVSVYRGAERLEFELAAGQMGVALAE